jgi:hypothetical protein
MRPSTTSAIRTAFDSTETISRIFRINTDVTELKIGKPNGPALQSVSINRWVLSSDIFMANARFSVPRVCKATWEAEPNALQAEEPLDMLKDTSGGFAPSEVTEVAVNATGRPVSSRVVRMATPEACRRKVALRASEGS